MSPFLTCCQANNAPAHHASVANIPLHANSKNRSIFPAPALELPGSARHLQELSQQQCIWKIETEMRV